jgi:hypothetical protein
MKCVARTDAEWERLWRGPSHTLCRFVTTEHGNADIKQDQAWLELFGFLDCLFTGKEANSGSARRPRGRLRKVSALLPFAPLRLKGHKQRAKSSDTLTSPVAMVDTSNIYAISCDL